MTISDYVEDFIGSLKKFLNDNKTLKSLLQNKEDEVHYFIVNYLKLLDENALDAKIRHYDIKDILIRMLLSHTNILQTVTFYSEFIVFVDNYFSNIKDSVSKVISNSSIKFTETEINKLEIFLYSFSQTNISIESDSFILKDLLRAEVQFQVLPNIKKDTLRKFYFNHVYALKNDIKIFDTNSMIYGETNNIMH